MATRNWIKSFTNKALAGVALSAIASVALAGPVGYLQIDGRISVQPDGATEAIRVSENAYTLFSNDRIDASHGSAVLVLNGGGVIGLSKGSSATIRQSESDNRLFLVLDRGSLAYSMPGSANNLTINVDEVQFETVAALQAASGQAGAASEAAGTLSVDQNRQVSALARAGDIRVLQPRATALASPVAAGGPVAGSSNAVSGAEAQAFDTLHSVSQGESVQVQTAGTVSVSAFAMSNDAGSTLIAVGGQADEELRSVSP